MWRRARTSDELSVVRPMRLFHWSNMYLSLLFGGATSSTVVRPMRLFHMSNMYLSLLFVAVALDPLLKR